MMHFTDQIPARAFGFHSDKTVLGFKQTLSRVGRIVPIDVTHAFDPMFFEQMRLWWEWKDTRAPLFISGPTGCGKTSGVLQFLARVRCPAITFTCRAHTDKNDLVGNYAVVESGGFVWQDGPAALAWRYGLTLVINEFTLAPAEVWVSANDILEGDAIVNERTGEVIERHANARVIITDNTLPAGDDSEYLSRNDQDASVIDRCWHIRMHYLDGPTEAAMLTKKLRETNAIGRFENDAIAAAVRFAQKSREPNTARCMHPISSRVLERFLSVFFRMREAGNKTGFDLLEKALSLSLTAGLNDEEQTYLQQLAHFEFAAVR